MPFFENLHNYFAAAMSRHYRRLARTIWRRLVDLANLFKTTILFVPLIFLASGGHELTYSGMWLLSVVGWIVVGVSIIFILWAIAEEISKTPKEDTPEYPYVWILCLLLSAITVGFIMTVHHPFQSPILAATQRFPASVRHAFQKNTRVGAGSDFHAAELQESSGAWARIDSTPMNAKNSSEHLNLWVERIQPVTSGTLFYVACKTWYENESETLNNADGSYIVDANRTKYDLLKDFGEYSFFKGQRSIVGSEIYRWRLLFPRIPADTRTLRLKHPQFHDIEVNLAWSSTQVDTPPLTTSNEIQPGSSQAMRPDSSSSSDSITTLRVEPTTGQGVKSDAIRPKPDEGASLREPDSKKVTLDLGPTRSTDTKLPEMFFWVTGVELFRDRTVLKLACRAVDEATGGYLLEMRGREQLYLAGENGNVFEFVRSSAQYTGEYIHNYGGTRAHVIRPNEKFRFEMEFQPAPLDTKGLKLYHRQFGIIDIPLASPNDSASQDR